MIKKNFKFITIIVLYTLSIFCGYSQQLKTPVLSPLQSLEQSFGLSNIKIEYSRPSVRGRIVYGELVPYGKMWRTGANASTKITFGDSVNVEGKGLASGSYALYTVPGKESWDIIFYKDLTLGGSVDEFKTENEALRIQVKPMSLSEKVETFTINIGEITSTSAVIELVWEMTRVAFRVTTDVDTKVMKNIETMVIKDSRPYYQAANYYFDNNKDLKLALDWATKAADLNPKFWTLHLKAKIQLKMKDFKGTIASAEKSMTLAKENKFDEYVTMNEKLIVEAKKGETEELEKVKNSKVKGKK